MVETGNAEVHETDSAQAAAKLRDAAEQFDLALSSVTGSVAAELATDSEMQKLLGNVERNLSSAFLMSELRRLDPMDPVVVMFQKDPSASALAAAVNMQRSIEALGPALAAVETPVSPQLARSLQATENAWRAMEEEFGMLSSLEVSQLVGSRSPNRSYASEQRAQSRLLAVKRVGGLRYPGFQFHEHAVRPLMRDLIRVARDANNSEADLALWLVIPTGYLDGDRPVDRLEDPEAVVQAASGAFNVQW